MSLKVIAVGKLRESFYKQACDEYLKRISRFVKVEVVEVKDESDAQNPSPADIEASRNAEGMRILSKLGERDIVITLDICGEKYDSVAFSGLISDSFMASGTVALVVGGSNGLAKTVRARADYAVSFSDMTFPHTLFRVMLLEQLYRALKIGAGERYHK